MTCIHLSLQMLLLSLYCLNAQFLYLRLMKMLRRVVCCQSGCILQPVLNMILLVGLCLSAVFITQAFQFCKSIFIRNLFHSRTAAALLILRWQVAWKWGVRQTQAVSTWLFSTVWKPNPDILWSICKVRLMQCRAADELPSLETKNEAAVASPLPYQVRT